MARVDFLIREHRTIIEFDGMSKYEGVEDLASEKRREDTLRSLGYEVVRITWEDLSHPDRVLSMLRAAFERAAARAT